MNAGHIEATWVNIIIFPLLLGTALGNFAFYSALVAYHITWRACFFKRSCMVIVLIKAFVYNCTIMPPNQSLVEFKAPPDLSSFPLATCWAEVQKTNSPSRLPLLSCNNRKKKLLSFSLTQSTHSHLLWWHGKSWFVLNNDCSNVRLELTENSRKWSNLLPTFLLRNFPDGIRVLS